MKSSIEILDILNIQDFLEKIYSQDIAAWEGLELVIDSNIVFKVSSLFPKLNSNQLVLFFGVERSKKINSYYFINEKEDLFCLKVSEKQFQKLIKEKALKY
jgi:hypothetical protein